jgi:hypothetical protein
MPRVKSAALTAGRSLPIYPDNRTSSVSAALSQKGQKRHWQSSKIASYSMTSSARASSVGETVKPSALAVLRLITNSYLVGA